MQNKFYITIALFFIILRIYPQVKSPLSEIGIGNLNSVGLSSNYMMGGITSAYISSKYINPLNPASLSRLRYTTAETGLHISQNNYTQNNNNSIYNNFTTSSAIIGFPLARGLGFAAGILPFSTKNYSYQSTNSVDGDLIVTNKSEGKGNVSDLFLGFGAKFKFISVGARGSFLFGNLQNISKAEYSSINFVNVREIDNNIIRGFNLDLGTQIELKVNEEKRWVIGGNARVFDHFYNTNYQTLNDYLIASNVIDGEVVRVEQHVNSVNLFDNFESRKAQKVLLPTKYDFGISYSKENSYLFSLQYNYENWKDFAMNNSRNYLSLSQKISFGGEWLPNVNAGGYGSFWKKMNYRVGFYAGEAPFIIENNQVFEYGINFGLSAPLKRMKYETELFGSYLNFGVGYGYRGVNSVIAENIFHFNLSVVLNDKWFIQRKFN
jgi:hypothetical protein